MGWSAAGARRNSAAFPMSTSQHCPVGPRGARRGAYGCRSPPPASWRRRKRGSWSPAPQCFQSWALHRANAATCRGDMVGRRGRHGRHGRHAWRADAWQAGGRGALAGLQLRRCACCRCCCCCRRAAAAAECSPHHALPQACSSSCMLFLLRISAQPGLPIRTFPTAPPTRGGSSPQQVPQSYAHGKAHARSNACQPAGAGAGGWLAGAESPSLQRRGLAPAVDAAQPCRPVLAGDGAAQRSAARHTAAAHKLC